MTDLKLVTITGWNHYADWSWKTGDAFEDFHIQRFKISRHQWEEMDTDKAPDKLSKLCKNFKPTKCDRCGKAPAGETLNPGASATPKFDTPDETNNRPGDMWYSDSDYTYCGFQNCDKKHLYVRLPCGGAWDTDSRANNCTKPDDKVHRCWVKHTEKGVENMTIDKNGVTCGAGAGSIQIADGWHGFIRQGMLIKA